ncbi:MAG: GGDEF domain-containing protein [Desulfomonilaceae bacterium]
MNLILDNRTLTTVQVAVSVVLCIVMFIAWRTQKTYPGFGRWTLSKVPHAIGFLLISLRGLIPDWVSVLVANGLLFVSPIVLYEGIRQFCAKPHRDLFNYSLMLFLLASFNYFFWVEPNMKARMLTITACTALIIMRCAANLFLAAPRALRPSFWFTAAMFGLYGVVLVLRLLHGGGLSNMLDPLAPELWQNLLFVGTIVMPIGWTFGFFMMTNDRLTLELRTAEGELRELAATDFLTGAFNRRSFVEMSQRECLRARRHGSSLALLIMDIDHFKHFNDTFGHPAGDAMLCAMVDACRASLRAIDLFARWGGEEFVVLLPDTDYAGSLRVAEQLRGAVADLSVPAGTGHAQATISIGGALWTRGDEDLDALLRRADIALYQAKQRGRNCVVM